MKETGETFFPSRKKKSRRGKIPKISKISGKMTLAGQNSRKFFNKHRRGNFLLSINNEKNPSGKKTERESNIVIFLLFFCLPKNIMYIFLAK